MLSSQVSMKNQLCLSVLVRHLKSTNHTVCITETGGSSANCSSKGRKKKAQTRAQILLEGMFTISGKDLLSNILSLWRDLIISQ